MIKLNKQIANKFCKKIPKYRQSKSMRTIIFSLTYDSMQEEQGHDRVQKNQTRSLLFNNHCILVINP